LRLTCGMLGASIIFAKWIPQRKYFKEMVKVGGEQRGKTMSVGERCGGRGKILFNGG